MHKDFEYHKSSDGSLNLFIAKTGETHKNFDYYECFDGSLIIYDKVTGEIIMKLDNE